MIIDTHAHYNLDPLVDNWREHLALATQHGVIGSIIVGVDVASSKKAIELVHEHHTAQAKQAGVPQHTLRASVGIHPLYASEGNEDSEDSDLKALASLCAKQEADNSPIIAIGEIGLDYYRLADHASAATQNQIAAQKQAFVWQLELAIKHKLPVILHVRDKEAPEEPTVGNAYWDTLALLKQALKTHNKTHYPLVFHCASGPQAYLQEGVSLGGFVGIAGNSTYPSAHQLRAILRQLPKDRLLLETDAPYLAPQAFRGKQCAPWMISATAAHATERLDISLSQIAQNTARIFPSFL